MAAYAYFDQNGNLLEFVSDRTLRQNNTYGVNKIYVYIEPFNRSYVNKSLRQNYRDIDTDTTLETTMAIVDNVSTFAFPTFKDYDPTHFVTGKSYPFVEVTIPEQMLNLSGSKVLSLAIEDSVNSEAVLQFASVITFYVQANAIQYTETISQSEFDYLLSLIGEIDDKAFNKNKTIWTSDTIVSLGNISDWDVGQMFYIKTEYKLYELRLVSDVKTLVEVFNFLNYYTKSEIDAKIGLINADITALNNSKQDKLTEESLETTQLQYAVGFDSQGNLRKGAGGGGGGATYTAGTGIDITNFTISIDDTVVETKTHAQDTYATKTSVENIEALIPAQASSSNKLADKDFVNSSISTNTANFLGTFNLVTDLSLTTSATHSEIATAIATKLASLSITPTNNDYVFVAYPDATVSTQFTQFDRYKYNASLTSWEWEYTLNNSSFTAQQWAAINSGITASMIANFVDLDSAQTIPGEKTFSSGISFGNRAKIDKDSSNRIVLYYENDDRLKIGSSNVNCKCRLDPDSNNTYDLGRNGVAWKDLYLSGKLKDETNEVSVAELKAGLSETTTQSTGGATSIQLKTWVGTQAQYDSIVTKDANTQYIII